MSIILPANKPTVEAAPGKPRSLKTLVTNVVKETIDIIPRKFGESLTEEHQKELIQTIEKIYLKIPERDTLEFLETDKDAKALVEESFELIDGDGTKFLFAVKPGKLNESGITALTEPALFVLAVNIINVSLGNTKARSNYSHLLSEVIFIHGLIQKKRLLQRDPKEEVKFSEEEMQQLAENLTNSLIDVRGLILKLENKINTGQYL